MMLETWYKVCKKGAVSENEALGVIECFIKLVKNRVVKINSPLHGVRKGHIQDELRARLRYQQMMIAYDRASNFIIALHDVPETITVKVYL